MTDEERRVPIVEHRSAHVDGVNFKDRTITVIAVPYESPAPVEYRGQMWQEVFTNTAFDGIETRQKRIPVYSVLSLSTVSHDHTSGHLVGKVSGVESRSAAGLLCEMRVSKTSVGDETLELAADDALSPSVGFGVRGSDQALNRSTMTRRINRAFLDHIALVGSPAYKDARILAVRANGEIANETTLSRLITPNLDEFADDPIFRYAAGRAKDS